MREEDAASEETGDDPAWPAARAAIPPINRQVLGAAEAEGEVLMQGGGLGQRDVTDKLASLTSVFAVSGRPFATRWFLISISSSFSEKVIRDWATTLAL